MVKLYEFVSTTRIAQATIRQKWGNNNEDEWKIRCLGWKHGKAIHPIHNSQSYERDSEY